MTRLPNPMLLLQTTTLGSSEMLQTSIAAKCVVSRASLIGISMPKVVVLLRLRISDRL